MGGGGGSGTPTFFKKLDPNEKCIKGMQVRKQGWSGSKEVHHIPHTWVNSCREASFSRMGGGCVSQPKNWTNSCRGVGLVVHPLNLGQFSIPMRFSLDTGFHYFGLQVLENP